MWRDDLPASLGCHLALVIDLDSVEQQRPHELRIRIIDEDGGPVAEVQGGFQAGGGDLAEIIHVPVTLDLTPAAIEKHGTYDVKIYVDGHHEGDLTVRALPRPQAQ